MKASQFGFILKANPIHDLQLYSNREFKITAQATVGQRLNEKIPTVKLAFFLNLDS